MIYDRLWLTAIINIITPFNELHSIASLCGALAAGMFSSQDHKWFIFLNVKLTSTSTQKQRVVL